MPGWGGVGDGPGRGGTAHFRSPPQGTGLGSSGADSSDWRVGDALPRAVVSKC